ncbi:MAG: PHP domain-containing protein, partial [Selenomonadaceae bacterium]|nr:PHP domain-containing protein [Selenomonadaceae bacterium]
MLVKIAANAKYDDYLKETVLFVNALEILEKKSARQDTAEIKRVELHVHTQMSAMDAIIPVEKLIQTAADWNWPAVAITDHGVIQAFPNAAQTAEKLAKSGKKIKIIYGMEGYLVGDDWKQKFANHVIILAKNKRGLENLYKLISISQIKFMHYRPRIPKTLLSELRDGLIIGSACEAGELIRAIVAGKDDSELETIANFYDYLEIQPIHNNDFLVRSEDFPNIKSDDD